MATFGYETIGSSSGGFPPFPDFYNGYKFTCPSGGTATKITVRIGTYSSDRSIKGTLHKASDLTLVTDGITNSALITSGDANTWKDLTFSTPPTLTAQDYIVGFVIDNGSGAFGWKYDTGTTNFYLGEYNTYSSPTNLTGPLSGDYKLSIYVTYTPIIPPAHSGFSFKHFTVGNGMSTTEVAK